jgi:hypothetical protein
MVYFAFQNTKGKIYKTISQFCMFVKGSCEQGKESSGSIKDEELLTSRAQIFDWHEVCRLYHTKRNTIMYADHLALLGKACMPSIGGFAPRSVHVTFSVDKVTLGQVSLRVLRFPPVNIIPPLLHIHTCNIWGMDNGPVSGRSST